MRVARATAVTAFVLLAGCGYQVRIGGGPARVGSGIVVKESRAVGEFRRIEAGGATAVTLTVEDNTAAEIEFDDNLIGIVSMEVRDETLFIRTRESFNSRHSLKVKLRTPQLDGIKLSGAAKAEISGVNPGEFSVAVSGAAAATVSGTARKVIGEASGAGKIHGYELVAEHVTVSLSGATAAEVHATESLDATVSGAGNVTFKGEPKQVQRRLSGAGSLQPAR